MRCLHEQHIAEVLRKKTITWDTCVHVNTLSLCSGCSRNVPTHSVCWRDFPSWWLAALAHLKSCAAVGTMHARLQIHMFCRCNSDCDNWSRGVRFWGISFLLWWIFTDCRPVYFSVEAVGHVLHARASSCTVKTEKRRGKVTFFISSQVLTYNNV